MLSEAGVNYLFIGFTLIMNLYEEIRYFYITKSKEEETKLMNLKRNYQSLVAAVAML